MTSENRNCRSKISYKNSHLKTFFQVYSKKNIGNPQSNLNTTLSNLHCSYVNCAVLCSTVLSSDSALPYCAVTKLKLCLQNFNNREMRDHSEYLSYINCVGRDRLNIIARGCYLTYGRFVPETFFLAADIFSQF